VVEVVPMPNDDRRRHGRIPLALIAMLVALGPAPDGRQRDMFSASDAYERFMGRWSRGLAPGLVRFAGVREGEFVLDVGSGTGALAEAVTASVPRARVVGIDPSAGYIDFARATRPDERVRFEVGDARDMRFDDAAFDRTLSLLVVNFIPEPDRAVSEMVRVTRPGGTVAAAVWDYGAGMEMLRVFWDAVVTLWPDAEDRDERHMPLTRPGELATLWRNTGLLDVSEQELTIRTRFDSFEDYWLPFLGGQGPAGDYVSTLSSEDRERLRAVLRRRLLGEGPDRPIVLAARAWAVKGMAP
jgi:SAM-dependent methyltransferase